MIFQFGLWWASNTLFWFYTVWLFFFFNDLYSAYDPAVDIKNRKSVWGWSCCEWKKTEGERFDSQSGQVYVKHWYVLFGRCSATISPKLVCVLFLWRSEWMFCLLFLKKCFESWKEDIDRNSDMYNHSKSGLTVVNKCWHSLYFNLHVLMFYYCFIT